MQDGQIEASAADQLLRNDLQHIDAYWRAANYLTVGQIYLLDNPLLREPLRIAHGKPEQFRKQPCHLPGCDS